MIEQALNRDTPVAVVASAPTNAGYAGCSAGRRG